METIGSAIIRNPKVLLQGKNTQGSLEKFTAKTETIPKFIKGELAPLYNSSELEFVFVHAHCLKMGANLQIDIGLQTIISWYENMLKLKWTKKIFLERLEAVQRLEIYNRIGWDMWLRAGTIMYAAHEMERLVDLKVNMLIQKGMRLSKLIQDGFALTEEEKKYAELAASKELEFELSSERNRLIEEAKNEYKIKRKNELRQKRASIKLLTYEQRESLLNECISENILKISESQHEIYIKYLEHFADLIPNSLIQKINTEE